MDQPFFTRFARNFIKNHYRDRFAYEALNMPHKIADRMCHRISNVFEDEFKDGTCDYEPDDPCLFFNRSDRIIQTTWKVAMSQIGERGGGGYLIIDATGRKFYAESEGYPPPLIYAGDLS